MERIWQVLDPAPQSFLDEHPELPPAVANLLFHRNIKDQKKIDEFLQPDYSQDVHDPYLFSDMEKAVQRIFQAIEKKEKIIIHGDYDADGVSASVILVSALKNLGATDIDTFLPHRETDGYGLNKNTIQNFINDHVNLIITCDCGVSNVAEIKMARENNMDVIVTDHHSIPAQLPEAIAIIHPLTDSNYPDKGLAGGGVAFKLVQGLLKKHLSEGKTLLDGQTHEAFEKWLLDMVAIATVGDMVPLIGESRTFTKHGLIVLNKTRRIGLQKLLLESRIVQEDGTKKKEIDADTIGYQIAPRINAAGRMNHASVAYNLMITDNPEEAAELAIELNQENQNRQKMTESLVKEALDDIKKNQKDNPVLFHVGEGWSTGIVGLIAGRIKEKYYKPTIIMARNNAEITGSGRSIEEFNMIAALQEMPEMFTKFGGHPAACGFTLKNIDLISEFQNKLIEKFVEQTVGLDIAPKMLIDAEIDLDDVNWDLFDTLEKFKPFGQANEKPKYLAKNLTIVGLEPVGKDKKHLRIIVKHNSHKIRKTIGWFLCNENGEDVINWGKVLKVGDKIDMVFEIDVNQWNGNRELQLTIVDLKK